MSHLVQQLRVELEQCVWDASARWGRERECLCAQGGVEALLLLLLLLCGVSSVCRILALHASPSVCSLHWKRWVSASIAGVFLVIWLRVRARVSCGCVCLCVFVRGVCLYVCVRGVHLCAVCICVHLCAVYVCVHVCTCARGVRGVVLWLWLVLLYPCAQVAFHLPSEDPGPSPGRPAPLPPLREFGALPAWQPPPAPSGKRLRVNA